MRILNEIVNLSNVLIVSTLVGGGILLTSCGGDDTKEKEIAVSGEIGRASCRERV